MAQIYFKRDRSMHQNNNEPNMQDDNVGDVPLFFRVYMAIGAITLGAVCITAAICTVALMILGTVRLFRIYG